MTTLTEMLKKIQAQLSVVTECPRIEAESLLQQVLNCTKSYLYSHSDEILTVLQNNEVALLVERRCAGEPLAYLLGFRDFWSLSLKVNEAVLIPRSDTELLVETVLSTVLPKSRYRLVDLGTGSGAIAIAIAHERPSWQIYATDRSASALAVASDNAQACGVPQVQFFQGDWCQALPLEKYDIIVSNPPYIAEGDPHLEQGDLRYEPRTALVAGQQGHADLFAIIQQAKHYLVEQGWLFLEHGYTQGAAVRQYLQQQRYQQINTHRDLAGLERVTVGQYIDTI